MEKTFERFHLQQIITRSQEPRRFLQVIFGPRQVGKTTLVSQLLEKKKTPNYFISADAVPASNTVWLEQQWEVARLKMDQQQANEFLLVIDEIQKVTNWSETIKLLWDADTRTKRNLKVILLGSSRLLLQQGLSESLAGRFETTYMGHWSFREMHQAFGWNSDQYAWFGGYPGSAELIGDEPRWKAYVQQSLIETSISKDILMLTRIDKPALMKRLFELGCAYSGQILSYNKMIGQLQDVGNTTTLSHYLDLLNTAGLLAGVEKFAGNLIYKRSSSPKFQVHNTALISAQSEDSLNEIQLRPADWGRIVESSIGAHLINHSITEGFTVSYWRERNEEVDFVLEKKGKVVGIEVKSGANQSSFGIEAFKRTFNPSKVLLIGNTGMPWQEFLQINPAEVF
ncbi:ATP-binding protein [Puia sp.]|uniref:ATP-binding protein n=1 Tax=Puia sp. TaxID=2045100 RepID=UPI002F417DF1